MLSPEGRVDLLGGLEHQQRRQAVEAALFGGPAEAVSFGRYRVLHRLGQGGMGSVYAAYDDHLDRKIALKLIRAGRLDSVEIRERTLREARALARLSHPNVVHVYEVGELDGQLFVAMEFLAGPTLRAWLDGQQRPWRETLAVLQQAGEGLAAAHAQGIVHRDFKPQNAMLGADRRVRVLDFGLACLGEAEVPSVAQAEGEARPGEPTLTMSGTLLGTPAYMAPEQFERQRADARSDQFTFCVVLYEALYGYRPFAGATLQTLAAAIKTGRIAARPKDSQVPQWVHAVVTRGLQTDPAKRWPSMRELLAALERDPGARARRIALSAALLAGAGAAAGGVEGYRRWDVAQRAQKRFDDVRRIANSMLFEVEGKLQGLEGTTEARAVIVSRALEYLDELADEAADDPALSRELAAAYVKIGEIQGGQGPNLGRPGDALVSYAKARQLVEPLVASGQDDTATRWMLARILFDVGAVQYSEQGAEQAQMSIREASRIIYDLPMDAAFDHHLAAFVYLRMAEIAMTEGAPAEAERHAKACLEVVVRWNDQSSSPDARYWLGVAREMFALVRASTGDPEAALLQFDEARTIFAALAAEYPQNAAYRRELWTALYISASWLSGIGSTQLWPPSTGDLSASEEMLREALVLAERLAERDVKDSRAAAELAATLDQLAATIAERDPAASLPLFERARRVIASLPEPARESAVTQQYEWFGQCAMAAPLAKLGRHEAARAALDRALPMALHRARTDRLDARLSPTLCRHHAARAQQALGDAAAAAHLLEENAAELRQTIAGRSSVISPYIGLVETLVLMASLRPERRCELLDEAADVWGSWRDASTPYTRRRLATLEASVAACRAGR